MILSNGKGLLTSHQSLTAVTAHIHTASLDGPYKQWLR